MSNTKKLVREAFRQAVFERDGHKCRMCGAVDDLDAHHITDRREMPNGGYVAENGISLCPKCHLRAEKFHMTDKKEWEPGYHPDELYAAIGASWDTAWEAADLTLSGATK
jgi:5-methylcytosine-specific restriction endonuclease McrA